MRPSFGESIIAEERRQRARRKKIGILCVFAVMIIAGIAAVIFVMKKSNPDAADTLGEVNATETESEEVMYTVDSVNQMLLQAKLEGNEEVLDEMKTLLDSGLSAVEAFRILYEDEIVIASGGKYHFIPIQDDLKKNNYLNENLNVLETGEFQYLENGEVVSYKGIDVSRFQGEIDWEAVKEDGVEFAFIRVGYRGYGTGEMVEDSQFEENIKGANAAGVKVGVYFFSQAITEEEVLEEVNFVLEKIAPYKVECPVVFDVEKVAGSSARMNALTAEQRTAFTKLFCDSIEEAGYQSMIYFNLEMASLLLNIEELEAYDKWFAYYNPDFYFPYDFKVWQYSEKGTVAGIKEKVDLNISFAPLWE